MEPELPKPEPEVIAKSETQMNPNPNVVQFRVPKPDVFWTRYSTITKSWFEQIQ